MKNILITGENGYVGNQFQYLMEKDGFKVERIGLKMMIGSTNLSANMM